MKAWIRAVAALLLLPLALAGCLVLPGKFESTLTIRADRSFTYTYKGNVQALDLEGLMGKGMAAGMAAGAEKDAAKDKEDGESATAESEENGEASTGAAASEFGKPMTPEQKAKQDEKFRELAAKLAKEAGYRTVEYKGNGLFYVDYAISGVLNHGFLYPYNLDGQMIMPWVAVELRGKDMIRVKAPGFAMQDTSGMGGMGSGMSGAAGLGAMSGMTGMESFEEMNGTFTLITDAEIVSQNNEDGAKTSGATKTISWKIDVRTPDAPMASLRVKPAN